MNPPRILLGGIFHETNTFADDHTGLNRFTIRRGTEVTDSRGDGSPLGAFLTFAEEQGWSIVPTTFYRAMPSGLVLDEALEAFWHDFAAPAREGLRAGVDAIFLLLHGAMVTESVEDVEGTILQRIRSLPGAGELPLFGVTDLHGNFTQKMAQHANCLVTFRENPHTDAAETAVRAGKLLARTLESGRVPNTHWRQLPIVWPPTGTATAATPMRELETLARRLEARGLWCVNVYAGFALADIWDTGVSISISSDHSDAEFDAALGELECTALAHARAGFPKEWDLEAALDDIASKTFDGPILLVEPGDNVGGGAPGDGTSVLRALVSRRVANSAVIINDPQAVEKLNDCRIGEWILLAIGGKGSRLDPGPCPELEVKLVSRSNGVFDLEDPQSHLAALTGTRVEMGPCAVVKHGFTTILLTTHKTAPLDLGQWSSQGIDARKLGVIGVKAAVAHRRAYDKIAAASYTVETPGPCSSDLAKLPFRRLRRPVLPLDPLSALERKSHAPS